MASRYYEYVYTCKYGGVHVHVYTTIAGVNAR